MWASHEKVRTALSRVQVYFDNVVPNKLGSRKPVLYPLYPSYWAPSLTASDMSRAKKAMRAAEHEAVPRDPDVERGGCRTGSPTDCDMMD